MEDFKYLSPEELDKLSRTERVNYQRQKRMYENQQMVQEVLDSDDNATKTIDDVVKEEKGTPAEPETDKKKRGRPKKEPKDKKKQMVLTLNPTTYEKLLKWAESKPRTAPNYISDYVEEHIDEIIK